MKRTSGRAGTISASMRNISITPSSTPVSPNPESRQVRYSPMARDGRPLCPMIAYDAASGIGCGPVRIRSHRFSDIIVYGGDSESPLFMGSGVEAVDSPHQRVPYCCLLSDLIEGKSSINSEIRYFLYQLLELIKGKDVIKRIMMDTDVLVSVPEPSRHQGMVLS